MARSSSKKSAVERWIVDAIEETPTGKVARIELPSGQTADMPLHDLPEGVKEGDILGVKEGPDGLMAEVLTQETERAKAGAQAKLDALNAQGATPAGEEITL